MSDLWTDLATELSHWQAAGLTATLWWRDDDAVSDTLALRRLSEVAAAPVALAVIPAEMQPDLPQLLAATDAAPGLFVLQHGFRHQNYEPAERKKAELGAARPAAAVLAELATGWVMLQRSFGARALPVLTPPWNRIDAAVVAGLPQAGFRGITTYLPRRQAEPVAGLRQVNTHVDIIDWHGTRGFLGTEPVLDLLLRHLRARRQGAADITEPTGLLTHHLVHDAACWSFLQRLQDWLSRHPVIRWLPPAMVFGLAPDRME